MGRDFPHPSRLVLGSTLSTLQCVQGLLIRDKAAGAWRYPSTPSSAVVKERVELYLCSPYGLSWSILRWTLPSTFTFHHHHHRTTTVTVLLLLLPPPPPPAPPLVRCDAVYSDRHTPAAAPLLGRSAHSRHHDHRP